MSKTTKSFKVDKRDKPKHSVGNSHDIKKGGGGGKGTWGNPMDDEKYMDTDEHALDLTDPNYDPADQQEAGFVLSRSVFVPAVETSDKFVKSLKTLSSFKKSVRSAVDEHLISHDVDEFVTAIEELDYQLLHQEIPAILIKSVLDKKDQDRTRVSHLLQELHKKKLLTPNQVGQGFTKLYNSLDELMIDFPTCKKTLSDFVGHAIAAGYLDGGDAAKLEKEALFLENQEIFNKTKAQIREAITEYFTSEEKTELQTSLASINSAAHFEFVKQLVTISLDRSDKEREMVSSFLANVTGLTADSVAKGFLIMLGRVEDTMLDVPDVLHLMSCFIARAVIDEVLPPSFLVRVDLSELDMGFQVISQAQVLVNQLGSSQNLQGCWSSPSSEQKE